MTEVEITPEEIEAGATTEAHLAAAVSAVRDNGFVVLRNVVDPGHVAILRERMLEDVAAILARHDAPYNFNTGNVQQDPPPFAPFLFRDVLLNDIATAVTKAALGPGVKNSYYSGNTALPGGTRQPVHPDVPQLWRSLAKATPAFGFVVNVPLVDMDAHNGSTEIWPGSHLDTGLCVQDGDIKVPGELLERRRATSPPIQPSVRMGSMLIRDVRLWHAGMPNHSDLPRPMIAMIHWIGWWHAEPVRFVKGSEQFFDHPDLKTNAVFVDGPIDYIQHNRAYDFQR